MCQTDWQGKGLNILPYIGSALSTCLTYLYFCPTSPLKCSHFFTMAVSMTKIMVPMLVVMFLSPCLGMSNEVDYGNWNYREGGNVIK